jgi:formylmethanofuran dehydrogenase subunit C
MANLKISQLPEYTGSMTNTWTVLNNSGETATYKVDRENWLSGYATSADLSAVSSSIATTDLNQNNTIATLATTASINALSGSIATTDLGQNNRLTNLENTYATTASVNALSSSIASAGYAITGSNTFIGTETISGSVVIQGSGNTALNVNGGNSLFSGSIIINGSSPSGTKFLFFNNASGSAGTTVSYNPASNGNFSIFQSGSGVINIGSISGTNAIFGNTKLTGSLTQTGSLTVSGSGTFQDNLAVTSSANKYVRVSTNTYQSSLFASSLEIVDKATTNTGSVLTQFDLSFVGKGAGKGLTNDTNQLSIYGNNVGITGSLIISGSNHKVIGTTTITGSVIITGSLTNSGSFIQTGSVITTGSVQGNIKALTVSGFNTASMNLDDANFFSLQLVSGSAVHLLPSNIKPGQTVNVLVNTIGSGSITFPNTVRQISGSLYIPTYATGQDILTMVSFDSSSLYLANAKNFL